MHSAQPTYRRGQVEQAIARIHRVSTADGQALQALRSDLKRLLDIDRAPRSQKLKDGLGRDTPPAFTDDAEGPDKGADVGYRPFHAFALLIAYRLVETGMTQSRVVAFMRDIRTQLEPAFDALVAAGPEALLPKKEGTRQLSAEEVTRRVLAGEIVTRAEDMTYLIARAGSGPATFMRMHPVYHDLVFGNVCGFAQLKALLMRFDGLRKGVVVLGLTNAAHQVGAVLARTQAARRGRPSSRLQESA